jgi:thioesterase domain-containing protein
MLDNFFDLGGHSILAVKMMSRIKRVFGKSLPLNALFESPTVELLAKHIEDADRSLGPHTIVSIQASGSRPPIFWIPGGAALGLFRLTNIVTRLGPDQPVYGLGSNRPGTLKDVESVEERSRNYIELVRRVQPHGPYCIAGFCAGGRVAYEMAQQFTAAGEVVAFVGMIDCSFPNYPFGRANNLIVRLQRLRYQLRVARSNGVGLVGYWRGKLAERRAARAAQARETGAAPASRAAPSGEGAFSNQSLLDETVVVFNRYHPRDYPGRISLFLTDDEAYLGVSARLDARQEWTRHAASSEIRTCPGGHGDLFGAPDSQGFASTFKSAINDALRYHGIGVSGKSDMPA